MQGNRVFIVGLVCLFCALVCLGISVFSYFSTRSFVASATRTQGIVIRLEEQSSDSGTTYHPVFAFRDKNGNLHETSSTSGSNPPSHKVGDGVTVLYRTSHPDTAKLDEFDELWGLPSLLVFVAGADMLLGLSFLIVPTLWRSVAPRIR
jgi:hypothetical protein